jgi:8-oxo-dGTP pyrophosphatase MutT (NUDIX family)
MAKPATFAMGTAVYAERSDGKILLLLRAGDEASFGGQWFLPGGMVDDGELPVAGAVRELMEEAGIEPDGPLRLVGLYPIPAYGPNVLMVSYACSVGDGDVVISHEHHDSRWIEPERMRAAFTDERVGGDASGFLGDIRDDLDRFIARHRRRPGASPPT